jgi:hypothetical protein
LEGLNPLSVEADLCLNRFSRQVRVLSRPCCKLPVKCGSSRCLLIMINACRCREKLKTIQRVAKAKSTWLRARSLSLSLSLSLFFPRLARKCVADMLCARYLPAYLFFCTLCLELSGCCQQAGGVHAAVPVMIRHMPFSYALTAVVKQKWNLVSLRLLCCVPTFSPCMECTQLFVRST